MWPVFAGGFVVAHGLIHASFLTRPPAPDAPGPPWPFELEASWLLTRLRVPPAARRAAGRLLTAAVLIAFTVAGTGLLTGAAWWAPVGVVAAVLSGLQLIVWFHPWLVLGVAIDAAVAAAALGWWSASWLPGA